MSKLNKQIGKGGCFSTPKELNNINLSLKEINRALSTDSFNSLTQEEKDKLEIELNKLLTKFNSTNNNNTNNATKRKKQNQNQNNNNTIKRQLGLSDKEYAALSKELVELEKELLNSNV
jgi:hypothetical protein